MNFCEVIFEYNAIWQCIYLTFAQLMCIVLQTAKFIFIIVIYKMEICKKYIA